MLEKDLNKYCEKSTGNNKPVLCKYNQCNKCKNIQIMEADLRVNQEDLKALFIHTRSAYGNITFVSWCKECEKSYMSYFNNKELFNNRKYTYSQFVNSQIIALT